MRCHPGDVKDGVKLNKIYGLMITRRFWPEGEVSSKQTPSIRQVIKTNFLNCLPSCFYILFAERTSFHEVTLG